MATHDFTESLRYEQSKFPKADKFYTEILKVGVISRIGFEDDGSKALQRLDVDVSFNYNGRMVFVSEKDRKNDYNDILLEFYSMFPHKKGWINNSYADYLAYFVPGKVYWINKKQLSQYYDNYLSKVINDRVFAQMITDHPHNGGRNEIEVIIDSKKIAVTIVQAYNAPRNSDATWYTESICISFDVLREAGISITEYKI